MPNLSNIAYCLQQQGKQPDLVIPARQRRQPLAMGRAPCCDKANVKKGPWSPEEDAKLKSYIEQHGTGGNWITLPQKIGLKRCGKSCRLRWLNYLRPNIKHGGFSEEEDGIICSLYVAIGSRWSIIASQLPGRTDNDIKNYWNTKLKKKLFGKQRKESQLARQVGGSRSQESRLESYSNYCSLLLDKDHPVLLSNSSPSLLASASSDQIFQYLLSSHPSVGTENIGSAGGGADIQVPGQLKQEAKLHANCMCSVDPFRDGQFPLRGCKLDLEGILLRGDVHGLPDLVSPGNTSSSLVSMNSSTEVIRMINHPLPLQSSFFHDVQQQCLGEDPALNPLGEW